MINGTKRLRALELSKAYPITRLVQLSCKIFCSRSSRIIVLTSIQHPAALFSIYRCYLCGCRYPDAAADRPPRVPPRLPASIPMLLSGAGASSTPSKHPGADKRSRGLNAATPGSSPLSMRLGSWSEWVGKQEKPQSQRKASPKPDPKFPTGWGKQRRGKKKGVWAWTWRNTVPTPIRGIPRRQLLTTTSQPRTPASCYHRATPAGRRRPGTAILAPSQSGATLMW